MTDEVAADLAPDTEELTSADILREGPIERGLSIAEAFNQNLNGIAAQEAERAEAFKSQAFQADVRVKELEAELRGVRKERDAMKSALAEIVTSVQSWGDAHWFELQQPGNFAAMTLSKVLATAKRAQ